MSNAVGHVGTLIGRGAHASVFNLNAQTVMRIGSETDGFRLIADLTEREREYYKLPVIYHYDDDNYSATIERLYPIDLDRVSDINWDAINDYFEVPDDLDDELTLLIQRGIELHHRFVKDGAWVDLDLNSNNIMQRLTGELVISDPLGYLDI